jgi:curved DNA-binding protein CbpA
MGNQASAVDPVHLRMYQNLIQIQDPGKRLQIIQTCLASIEYVQSAKRAGLYSHLLHYVSVASSGQVPSPLPGERGGAPVLGGPVLSAPVSSTPVASTSSSSIGMRMAGAHPSMMSSTHRDGIAATHPSLLMAPTASAYTQQQQRGQYAIQTHSEAAQPSWKVVTDTPKQKAISYFSSCLEVLGIQEEVALTEESLKKAYKKMAIKAHPDKGGSEEFFEAVTRAYAYLSEILRYMRGGRGSAGAGAGGGAGAGAGAGRDAMEVQSQRAQEAEQWKHAEPVRLNAKNLDMNAFNKLFSETHMPDPDSDGYGDWLKGGDGDGGSSSQSMKFKGQFNRDVFNRMFEDEAKKSQRSGNQLVVHPGEMALTLNPSGGTELVAERPSSFTAAANSKFQYTDLRGAYSSEATISDKVANVTVSERKLDEYRASRERAPDPLSSEEMRGIQAFEERQRLQESMRERKKAEQAMLQQQYFDRMKRMVITDGAVDLNQGGRR